MTRRYATQKTYMFTHVHIHTSANDRKHAHTFLNSSRHRNTEVCVTTCRRVDHSHTQVNGCLAHNAYSSTEWDEETCRDEVEGPSRILLRHLTPPGAVDVFTSVEQHGRSYRASQVWSVLRKYEKRSDLSYKFVHWPKQLTWYHTRPICRYDIVAINNIGH